MQERNYTDEELADFVAELNEGQRKLLRLSGALPSAPFQELEPRLQSADVAQMIEIAEE